MTQTTGESQEKGFRDQVTPGDENAECERMVTARAFWSKFGVCLGFKAKPLPWPGTPEVTRR
jgi:hypothetical protein